MKLKKAAMFGLDARIALAIFGALSVISGAALYSAIQSAQTTKTFVTIQEITKAMEQYYLDNGFQIPSLNRTNLIYIGNLIQNYENSSKWNGPYFNSKSSSESTIYLNNFITGISSNSISAYSLSFSDWNGSNLTDTVSKSCSLGDCMAYLQLMVNDDSVQYSNILQAYNNLDKQFDNNDGPAKGKIRAQHIAGKLLVYFQTIPYKD